MKYLSPAFVSAIKASHIRLALLLRADLPAGVWYGWTGAFPLTYDGHEWEAVGPLISIGPYEEALDTAAKGVAVEFHRIDSNRLTDILSGGFYGREATMWLALFDASWSIIDKYTWFAGRLDKDSISIGADGYRLSLQAEHRLADLLRARVWRYTSEDQALLHPATTDTAYRYAHTLKDSKFSWGK